MAVDTTYDNARMVLTDTARRHRMTADEYRETTPDLAKAADELADEMVEAARILGHLRRPDGRA